MEGTITNHAEGVLTRIDVDPSTALAAGDTAVHIDERPVVVAVGDVPAFRDLERGTVGRDVRQLHMLLTDLGYDAGPPSDAFGPRIAGAVRQWQDDMGVVVDGTIELGRLLFIPELPATNNGCR